MITNLRDLRIEKGISQAKVSELTGLSLNSIWKYDKGMNIPPIDSYIKYANAIGYDLKLVKKGK